MYISCVHNDVLLQLPYVLFLLLFSLPFCLFSVKLWVKYRVHAKAIN